MKSRFLFLALVALCLTVPTFAATCTNFTFTVGVSTGPVGCTIDGGAVTFTNFSITGLAANSTVNVSFADGGALGVLSGVSFQPTVSGGTSYTVSYTAAVTGGNFTSVSDSATPGGIASYSYTGTGFNCPAQAILCGQAIASTTTLTNSATYTGAVVPNQTITLDFNTTPSGGVPEPTSMILFGSGFLAVGLVARARRKRS